MPAAIYRFIKLAWRYRRIIALGLTLFASLWEKNRKNLPGPLQKYEPPKRLLKKRPAGEPQAQ